jgi:hypothetical protein
MNLVVLPFKNEQAKETVRGLDISRWLKEHGLNLNKDYTWAVMTSKRELHFYFNKEHEAFASMLAMKEL